MKGNIAIVKNHMPSNEDGVMIEAVLAELKSAGHINKDATAEDLTRVPKSVRDKITYYFDLTRALGPESEQAKSFVARHAKCHPNFVQAAERINKSFGR